MAQDFYTRLEGFEHFDEVLDEQHYHRAPPDWWVVVTDIVGSTQAIESGRYKDVNTLGAATLAALKNAMPDIDFPYVFGGDGASALIPESERLKVSEQLAGLQQIAEQGFGLSLRAAMVRVSDLETRGANVMVGKFLLEGRYPLAVFRGNGLTRADALIKADSTSFALPESAPAQTDLRHVSCRWRPLVATRGVILSLLAQDPLDRPEVFRMLLAELEAITEGGLARANPVRVSSMRYRGLLEMMRADRRHQTTFWSAFPRLVDTFLAFLLFRLGLYRCFPKLRRYVTETDTHSDYRKFDGTLRMVLDVTPAESAAIEAACKKARQDYGICYGLHRSSDALMTCYVPSMARGQHLHFVDGGNGGYAQAAKQLKHQLEEGTEHV